MGFVKSGKTSFIEKIVVELKRRNYKVGALKHSTHSFEIDSPGKDSYRLKECGSDVGGIFSSIKMALVKDLDSKAGFEKLAFDYLYDLDIVFVEGYGKGRLPKILILSSNDIEKEIGEYPREEIIAVVGDGKIDKVGPGLEYFGKYEVKRIVDFIEEKYLKKDSSEMVDLFVNDRKIELNDYLKKLIGNVITGIIKSLKGVEEDIKTVEIKSKR